MATPDKDPKDFVWVQKEITKLVPGVVNGMPVNEALIHVLVEIKRLKEIEAKYEGLCK